MAIQFDGSSYYRTANGGSMSSSLVPLSIAAWVKLDNVSGNKTIWGTANTSSSDLILATYNDEARWAVNGAAGFLGVSGLSAGVWTSLIAIEHSTNNRDLYIDDTASGNDTKTASVLGTVKTSIGVRYSVITQSPFEGKIGRIVIWHGYALTPADRAAWRNGLTPYRIAPQYLAHYWPLRGTNPTAYVRDMVGGLHIDNVTGTPVKTESTYPRRGGV